MVAKSATGRRPTWKPIESMQVEIGVWQGSYQNQTQSWPRWWDLEGNLLLTGSERAESAEAKAARLAERLGAMGVDPDDI